MNKTNLIILLSSLILLLTNIAIFVKQSIAENNEIVEPVIKIVRSKPYERYTIENLSSNIIPTGSINVGQLEENDNNYSQGVFSFTFYPNLDTENPKVTTGLINIPVSEDPTDQFPLVLMFRGFVNQEIYQTGMGTRSASEYFAENGYITLAPDFLGYANSDTESDNIFETRFQTYTTAASMINTIIDGILPSEINSRWDGKNIFIWAHSNGGQVALTALEITEKDIPTTLWAPVSKPFPYSILYYTDESEDRGKLIRRELAKFEEDYDVDLYSFDLYLDRIKAPIQIQQGTADDAVPVSWNNSLENSLDNLEKEVNLIIHPGADHNMRPSWDTAIQNDLVYFKKYEK